MGFNRFSLLLALRLLLIMASLVALAYFVFTPGYHAATLLTLGTVVALTVDVFRFVSRTNQEITRFLDAARYADFGQRFNLGRLGAGFGDLGDTFSDILERFRESRSEQEAELRYLKALVEHVPVPLVSVHSDGQLTQWNNAARRLFGTAAVCRALELKKFGDEFAQQLDTLPAGQRQLVNFKVDGMERRLTIAASEITIAGAKERLISLQDIQSELDSSQVEAWQDLVRVLTHEIMNSITPVASLAKTTVDLVNDAAGKATGHPEVLADLADVKDAVDTVARRSDGLMNFVSSYRRLTRLPPPTTSQFQLQELFTDIAKLATVDWDAKNLVLSTSVEPRELDLCADREMIEQVLINMLQNSEQALADTAQPKVTVSARLNKRGHVTIEVSDNGPGIDEEISRRVFVPFFTTKRDGSGVGLALTRQVMIAHGGTVTVGRNDLGGARFSLIF
jgi:nitrogen fixation/metabolism regulation signal transduction histidine kinase